MTFLMYCQMPHLPLFKVIEEEHFKVLSFGEDLGEV
jgi:hypothetical protein